MKVAYPFLSSARNFEWQKSRQANASPILLDGRLVKRQQRDTSWSGCSLSSTKTDPLSSTAGTRASRYWDEFLNGRRTVDPSFNEIPPVSHSRSLSASAHPTDLGFRSKPVTLNGKAVRANTSSSANFLNTGRGDWATGTELYYPQESRQRKGRGKSEYYLRLSVSQIDTLPGTSPLLFPVLEKPLKKPSKKNISQILTLPGGCPTPPPPLPIESQSNTDRYFRKNLITSQEAEAVCGESPVRRSPIKAPTPIRQDLGSYKDLTREEGEDRRGKRGIRQNKTNMETSRETGFKRSLKRKPEAANDLFTPSFKLF